MPQLRQLVGPIILCWFIPPGCIRAQESAGQAEIGFQHYYLAVGSQRVANISGLTVNAVRFIPDVGLLSVSLSPALSNNRFRSGENFLRLKGLPWKGHHWTFTGGDFRISGQLVPVAFSNLYFPEIAGRGGAVEATHRGRTFGFFKGEGTISNSPRVELRVRTPQSVMGAYFKQKIGSRWLLGARLMHFSTDLEALRKLPAFLSQNSPRRASTASLNSRYNVAGPLHLYTEATLSMAEPDGIASTARNVPLSYVAGPSFDTKVLMVRANYMVQSASYFPLLGYYLGDRGGYFGEMRFRPLERLELYATVSDYRNNIAKDPDLPTFQSDSFSAGLGAQLPAKISLSAQFSLLDLSTRPTAVSPWSKSKNQQRTVTLARRFWRHGIRVGLRDFKDASPRYTRRQRSVELEDSFHIRRLRLGAAVRMQRLLGQESRTSLFFRGSAQFRIGRVSAYGNFETGSDLQNRTLFATNTVSTTVFGASVNLGKNWEFRGEAYRNNLVTELNPQSIFALQGQGVFIPGTLSTLNQWSMYFRIIRKIQWGKPGAGDLNLYTTAAAPLKGSVEGFVMERLAEGNRPAEAVPVTLSGRTVSTNAEGHFRFSDVPEGQHKVEIALLELPAEFDPGKNTESMVVVEPNKQARADFDVIRLAFIQGKVTAPVDVRLENVIIRMLPGDRYTTPDSEGNFSFYNLREAEYELSLDTKSLPDFAVIHKMDRVSVSVKVGRPVEPVNFQFEIAIPPKPVRRVLDKK